MELVALADRGFARCDVDLGWFGSHIGRSIGWSFDTSRDARIKRRASRCERDVLFGWRSDRCIAFRLRDRSVWPQEIVLHHSCGLSDRNCIVRFLLELLELRIVP